MKYATVDDATGEIIQIATDPVEWDGTTARMVPSGVSALTHRWDQAATAYVEKTPPAPPTLDELEADAHARIDKDAGAARRRYITDVAGQEAVYLRKAEQAREFAASLFEGEAPPYVAAEAQATGTTPAAATQAILLVVEAWDNVLSPQIEGARIGGKRAVTAAKAAGDADALAQALEDALAALRAV